jgi:hypothetical protein
MGGGRSIFAAPNQQSVDGHPLISRDHGLPPVAATLSHWIRHVPIIQRTNIPLPIIDIITNYAITSMLIIFGGYNDEDKILSQICSLIPDRRHDTDGSWQIWPNGMNHPRLQPACGIVNEHIVICHGNIPHHYPFFMFTLMANGYEQVSKVIILVCHQWNN